MKEEIIRLWKESFNDSDDFIKLFFERVYKNEQTLTIQKNGRIISSLQIVPYEMNYFGEKVRMGYVCGVCTLPEERGKGHMKELMFQAFQKMQADGFELATLIPASGWLFQFYEALGYTTTFEYSLIDHTYLPRENPNTDYEIVTFDNIPKELVYNYYHSKQIQRKCCVLHSCYDWETIVKDCILDRGNVWVALQGENPVGLALGIPMNNDKFYIKEIFYEKKAIQNELTQHILKIFNKKTAQIKTLPQELKSIPYGMAQIINKKRLIDLYISTSNNRFSEKYKLENLKIDCLTKTILHYEQKMAFMNLMLD